MTDYFKKQIMIPQDHGSWVFILSPLMIGVFAGRTLNLVTICLVLATMVAFMARQPITIIVKSYFGRRSKDDLAPAWFWTFTFSIVALVAFLGLAWNGFGFLILLASPGFCIFSWQLWLVSKREERKQTRLEILATGVLALAAPAAYWVGIGKYDPTGWWLFLWTWLQSSASIVYTYLRLDQREFFKDKFQVPLQNELWAMGKRALLYTSFNLLLSLFLGGINLIPSLIFLPFLIQWIETAWGVTHPCIGWKPQHIGMRQFFISSTWTVLFIVVNTV